MTWVKGKSGNPTGRPKSQSTVEFQALCRSYAPDAIRTIAKLMVEARQESVRLKAAQVLVERGYGRPAQETTIKTPDGAALQIETAHNSMAKQLRDPETREALRALVQAVREKQDPEIVVDATIETRRIAAKPDTSSALEDLDSKADPHNGGATIKGPIGGATIGGAPTGGPGEGASSTPDSPHPDVLIKPSSEGE